MEIVVENPVENKVENVQILQVYWNTSSLQEHLLSVCLAVQQFGLSSYRYAVRANVGKWPISAPDFRPL